MVGEVPSVSVEVPEPFAIELGTKLQVGAGVTTGAMLLQVRFSAPLKPLSGAMVTPEVEDPPAATEAGDSAEAVSVKSGEGTGLTVRLTDIS